MCMLEKPLYLGGVLQCCPDILAGMASRDAYALQTSLTGMDISNSVMVS